MWNRHIHKHWNCAILDRRGYRRRETCRNRDNLIAAAHPALSQQWGSQRHKCDQVRGGTGVYKGTVFDAQVVRKPRLKLIGVTSGGQPELQRTVYQLDHLMVIVNAGRIRNPLSLSKFFFLIMIFITILCHQIENLLTRSLFSVRQGYFFF